MTRPYYGAMVAVARANLNALRHCGIQAEIPAKALKFTGWLRELDLLIVADETAQLIQTGDVINLDFYQRPFMVTGPPSHDYGTRALPVARVSNYGVLLRSVETSCNRIEGLAANTETILDRLPVVCRNTYTFFVPPTATVRQGDLIEINMSRFLVLGVKLLNSETLLQLHVAQQ
ncbi:hypothetical protein [Geomonas oryzae]|uniref:hypothetical protein n=1 Tax=Geomonas oryzae TaxID=2364273 RepID=UPI00100BD329|nr:hypothetical protein [Geomonas oryzae]